MNIKQLSDNYHDNITQLNRMLRIPSSFDVIIREMIVDKRKTAFYFIDGFVKDDVMERIMAFLLKIDNSDTVATVEAFEKQFIPYVEVSLINEFESMLAPILSGTILVIMEGFTQAIAIDARTYPSRSISEPDDDRVLRGSRDSFVETLVFNTALIRRRIRDPHLTMKMIQVGSKSHTDVVMCYLSNVADSEILKIIYDKLKQINVESLTLAQESLAECLIKKQWWNPLPKIRYTERPDAASAAIMEGKVILIIDNSPSAMILPTSFFDFIQDTNDYYFPPLVGGYLRSVRTIVFLLALFLTPVWYLIIKNPEIFPDWINFIQVEKMNKVPIIVQLLIVEFIIDAIKLASLNTPSSLSGSFGVIGALVLGEFAVKAHWFVPEVLLYMAFVSIANFTQPSYELGYAFKLFRMILLVFTSIFNIIGFISGILFILIIIGTTSTITDHSYLYPLFPLNWMKLKQLILRMPINKKHH